MSFDAFSSLRMLILEMRIFCEIFNFLTRYNKLKKIPTKKTERVIIIPGFLFSDIYFYPLIKLLNEKGVPCSGWGLGVNRGYCEERKEELAAKITRAVLIGWSMGGVYARQIARDYPQKTSMVITLATPFRIEGIIFEKVYEVISGKTLAGLNKVMQAHRETTSPVPEMQIYTEEDGILPQENYFTKEGIKIRGTHLGIAYNAIEKIIKNI